MQSIAHRVKAKQVFPSGPEVRTNMPDIGVENSPLPCDSNHATARSILRTNAEETLRRHRDSFVQSSISYWLRGIPDPSGSLNRFRPDPSPELSYVIGVALSDGNINVHDYHREILLSVTDRDFASEFSRCLGRVLGRGEPYKVRWSEKRGRWIVQGSSILLHKFLNCNWFDLRKWIEHCGKCESAFLRAFYDGEGSICGKSLSIYDTNREMLLYIQDLLWHADIETTQLHLNTKAGTRLIDSKNGRTYIGERIVTLSM